MEVLPVLAGAKAAAAAMREARMAVFMLGPGKVLVDAKHADRWTARSKSFAPKTSTAHAPVLEIKGDVASGSNHRVYSNSRYVRGNTVLLVTLESLVSL